MGLSENWEFYANLYEAQIKIKIISLLSNCPAKSIVHLSDGDALREVSF